MEAAAAGPRIVGPQDAAEGFLGSIGVRFMIDGDGGRGSGFSLVEHPMSGAGTRRPAASPYP